MTRIHKLTLAPELQLPLDAATETFAILAKRGAGKSNAAVVMAEQMYDAGIPWVAVDPKGDWWGVLSSADGKGPGLPVLVLGGKHGHVPLEETAGRQVADFIVDQRVSCIVDVSLMSKAAMRRFLTDFASQLYKRNTEPLHVFAEEAHEYIPQRVTAGDTVMVGAWEKLVKWGRTNGLGVTLITQRSASLNNDVLTQVETLIALRTTGPSDQKAIRAWVDEHDSGAAMMAQLRHLKNGEAFVLSPQWLELDEPLRVTFARRRTFDSGATPKAGQKRTTPRTLADVDLEALQNAMAETIEKSKASDPVELRKRIADLQRQLTVAIADKPAPVVERVEIPIIDERTRELIASAANDVEDLSAAVQRLQSLMGDVAAAMTRADVSVDIATVRTSQTPLPGRTQPAAAAQRPAPRARVTRADTRGSDTTTGQGPVQLGKTERTILSVLIQHGPRTHDQLALLSGYSKKASTIGVSLGKLRKAGLVEQGQPIQATAAGVELLGDNVEQLPQGQALIDYWRSKFGLTEQRVLDAVLAVYPHETSQSAVAEATGYSPTASTIGVALGRLRKVGVIDRWRISDDFAQAAGLA